MIIGVNRSNFFIYLVCIIVSLLLIVGGIICFYQIPFSCADEILFGIGCGTLPSIIIAYLIDFANEERNNKKIKSCRDFFLFGLPHGVLWLAKEVIQVFYDKKEEDNLSFKCTFDLAVSKMEDFNNVSYNFYPNFIDSIKYGLDLIVQNAEKIMRNEQLLIIDGVFTQDEILTIKYALDECKTTIRNCACVPENGENIRLLINDFYKDFPEIKVKMDRIAVIKDNKLKNFPDIQK